MKSAKRWSRALVAVFDKAGLGDEIGNTLAILREVSAAFASHHGGRHPFAGEGAARSLDAVLAPLLQAEKGKEADAGKLLRRFLFLLVRKGHLHDLDEICAGIGEALDERRGILTVRLDSAFPVDAGYEAELAELVQRRTGAREVRFEKRVLPQLLGGCRLRMKGESMDATLRGRIALLKRELERPAE